MLGFRVDASLPSTIARPAAGARRRRARDRDLRLRLGRAAFECRFARNSFGPTLASRPAARRWTSHPVRSWRCAPSTARATATRRRRSPRSRRRASASTSGRCCRRSPARVRRRGYRASSRSGRTSSVGVDGHAWAACSTDFRLPLLDPGVHTLQVRQPVAGGAIATTAPMAWRGRPAAGDVAIAGLQTDLAVERGARLLRRAPRVRFALSHQAAVRIDVLKRGRKPSSA